MNITKLIQAAVNESKKSDLTEWQIGAVLVKNGKIVGRGHNRNSWKSERLSKQFGFPLWSLHAEMDAVLSADFGGNILFVAGRKKKNGNLIDCKPCLKCQKVLKAFGVTTVYYQNRDEIQLMEL